ncbi:MAG: hypothetical protein LBH82_00730, partial [Bacteroidales bacterium]|nr:hypothetical protein [Bacteroidales bacterium]
ALTVCHVAVVGAAMRLIAGFLTGTAILLAVATTPLAFVWFLFRNLFSSPIQNKKKAGCEWSVFFVC